MHGDMFGHLHYTMSFSLSLFYCVILFYNFPLCYFYNKILIYLHKYAIILRYKFL